jgi:acyl-CoA synthetase (NDP forming)
VAVAAALAAPPGDGRRLREIAAFAERRVPGRWLAEHEAKEHLRRRGVSVVAGRLALNEDDAVAAAHEVGWPVALKLSTPAIQHKTAIGGITLDVRDEAGVRDAYRRLGVVSARIACTDNPTADPAPVNAQSVLVEAMVPAGDETFVAVRYDAVVPVLVVGRGGTDVERHDDVTITPLPARGYEAIVQAADGLALLECNPVIGDVVVDATAQEDAT